MRLIFGSVCLLLAFHIGAAELPAPKKEASSSNQLTSSEVNGLSHYLLASESLSKSNWGVALAEFSKVLEKSSNSASAWLGRGGAHFMCGRFDEAVSDFTQAIKLDPTAIAYFNRANAYSAKAMLAMALEDFNQCLKIEPTNSMALILRAATYNRLNEFQKAAQDASAGLSTSPTNAIGLGVRGLHSTSRTSLKPPSVIGGNQTRYSRTTRKCLMV